jgi:hypothetical protein
MSFLNKRFYIKHGIYLIIFAFAERKYHTFKIQQDIIKNHYIEF